MAFLDSLLSEIAALGQPSGEVWFRGQADASWSLLPAILRTNLVAEQEKNLLARFRHRAMGVVRDHPADTDPARWFFLMQHHGLPTRLLDWTEAALAGLYFAVCSCPEKDGRLFILVPMALNEWQIEQRVLIAPTMPPCDDIFRASFRGTNTPQVTVAVHAYMSNDRLARQQGAFTVHGTRETFATAAPEGVLRSVVIPAATKPGLRRDLAFLGVTRSTLFHDLDTLASDLKDEHGIV